MDYDEAFGFETQLHPKNVIDQKKFEIKTPDVTIKVNPERSDLIETRVIGGVKYILICADENVEVNGVSINIKEDRILAPSQRGLAAKLTGGVSLHRGTRPPPLMRAPSL